MSRAAVPSTIPPSAIDKERILRA